MTLNNTYVRKSVILFINTIVWPIYIDYELVKQDIYMYIYRQILAICTSIALSSKIEIIGFEAWKSFKPSN